MIDCVYRGYGNREIAYCHYNKPWPNISQECDEKKCPLKKVESKEYEYTVVIKHG